MSRFKEFKKRVRKVKNEIIENIRQKFIALYLFLLFLFVGWLVIQFLLIVFDIDVVGWLKTIPYLAPAVSYVYDEIVKQSYEGIIYLYAVSSLFFLPVPLEVLFVTLLGQGFTPILLGISTLAGIIIGQHINYALGRYFGFLLKPIIKDKTRANLHGKLKKFGLYAILLINVLPLPFPLFNFIVGLVKYPYRKWALIMIAALVVKLVAAYVIFVQYIQP